MALGCVENQALNWGREFWTVQPGRFVEAMSSWVLGPRVSLTVRQEKYYLKNNFANGSSKTCVLIKDESILCYILKEIILLLRI